MSELGVYVAAPWASGAELRRTLLGRFAAIGATCTSTWLEQTSAGPEDFSRYSLEELRCFAEQNDADLEDSNVMFLVDPDRRGRETYAEIARGLILEKPVVWFGPPTLSAWRTGVIRVKSLDAGLRVLGRMAVAHADGARGLLLAHLCAEVA